MDRLLGSALLCFVFACLDCIPSYCAKWVRRTFEHYRRWARILVALYCNMSSMIWWMLSGSNI